MIKLQVLQALIIAEQSGDYMQSMIRKLRLERNMSQKQLAKVIGTSQQTISRIENDVMSSPVDLLVNIADLFDVSVDYLLGRKVRMKSKAENMQSNRMY